ncbi:DUF1328 domain-containing protein [Shewanella sp. 202IG2-18]|uniref:DUF1328 domain-containing protein n=1 Tax=Parashewanella hymeniacidonis TaxID=2807618 RepID=UPI00196008F2|nr:DUF1328 domain-containing protein [Parashewanella hymeniacidonis]MBM7074453.1 DUF1328 domain-containing protein [Parashewanella hymeniacidonis]
MLRWALIFFILAIIAALFGFGGIAGAAVTVAKVMFYIFAISLLVSVVMSLVNKDKS